MITAEKLWIMKITVILFTYGTLRKILMNLEKRLWGLEIGVRIESIQTTVLLRLTGIFRRGQEH